MKLLLKRMIFLFSYFVLNLYFNVLFILLNIFIRLIVIIE